MPKSILTEEQRLDFIKDVLRKKKNAELSEKYNLRESHASMMQQQKWIKEALLIYEPIFNLIIDYTVDHLVTELKPQRGSFEQRLQSTSNQTKSKIDHLIRTSNDSLKQL